MKKPLMATLIAVLATLSLSISLPASALTLKVATLSPKGSYWMKTMEAANKQIQEKTAGRVKFQFYPGGIMGTDAAVMKKIKIGQLHGAALSGGAFNGMVKGSQVYSLPRIMTSYGEVDAVRKKLDKDVRQSFEDSGWVNFGLAEGGFAYLMSKNAVPDVRLLAKQKVWVPTDDPASEAAADLIGVAPIPLSLGDVLAGLQTDLINAVFASPIAAIALQWHTQVEYLTDVPLVYFYATLTIKSKAFNRISPEDQKIVRKIMEEAFKTIDKQNRKDNEAAFAALKNQGIKVLNPSSKEIADWNRKTAQTTKKLVDQSKVDKVLYDKVEAILTDYRKTPSTATTATAPQ
ncbi:MAG: TRAP transporter substrate-binding protein DctP [Cellvibrionales bacterium]|nr:TRAP transporter substrate-binding protein DctP [Cellvibrionales bacterium]